jgi:hypothetical protein
MRHSSYPATGAETQLQHFTHASFWNDYRSMPAELRKLADRSFGVLKGNPQHPSLHLKKVGRYWSARVGIHYRAVGITAPDGIVWLRIVPHTEYERIIRS